MSKKNAVIFLAIVGSIVIGLFISQVRRDSIQSEKQEEPQIVESEYQKFLAGELFCPHCEKKVVDVMLDGELISPVQAKIKKYFHADGLFCPLPPSLPNPNIPNPDHSIEESVKKKMLAEIFLT